MVEQPTKQMVEFALQYAARNWPVFPLAVHGKVPVKGSNGLRDGTTDPQKIREMWTPNPEYNIGLVTGEKSGLIILDLDPRNGSNESIAELEKRYGRLPSTLLSRTARGGIHRFYRHPRDGQVYGNAIELDKLSGLDVRGDGGYIVAPGSRLTEKHVYKWVKSDFPIAKAPEWLLGLIRKAENAPTQAIVPEPMKYSAKGDKWLQEALSRATEGARNATGFWLSLQLRDDGISQSEAEEILRAYAARVPQGKDIYKESEALNSVKSAYRRPARQPARRRS